MCREANERDILDAYWEASVELNDEVPNDEMIAEIAELEEESLDEMIVLEQCRRCFDTGVDPWQGGPCVRCGGKGR